MSYCTKCGAKLQEVAQFCSQCGERLKTPAPPAPTPAIPVHLKTFAYVALSKNRERSSGSVVAETKTDAVKAVERLGLFPVQINESVYAAPHPARQRPPPGGITAEVSPGLSSFASLLGRFFSVLFSFNGRIPRLTFIQVFSACYGASFLSGFMIGLAAEESEPAYFVAAFPLLIAAFWVIIAAQVKRWHDRGKPGSMVLINFIPFIGIPWAMIELVFLKGTTGPNAYGEDPFSGKAQRSFVQKLLIAVCTVVGLVISFVFATFVAEWIHGDFAREDDKMPTYLAITVLGAIGSNLLACFLFKPKHSGAPPQAPPVAHVPPLSPTHAHEPVRVTVSSWEPESVPRLTPLARSRSELTPPLQPTVIAKKPLAYMEVNRNLDENGHARCSDNSCPCGFPGELLRPGEGYMYVSEEVVAFRKDCPTTEQAIQKARTMQSRGETVSKESLLPVIMCELGARTRGLELTTAGADARHWWKTGKVPIRATPLQ